MIPQFAQFLSQTEVLRIHEASLEILEEAGLLVRNSRARERMAKRGCLVDEDTGIVRLPSALVEELCRQFPPTFTFRGRDPAFDKTLPDDAPVISTGSSAPNIIDPVTGELRCARSDDIARIAHLVNELDGYDVFSISTLADDAPEGQFSLSRFYPALKNCLKPVRTAVLNPEEALQVLELGELIAGSKGAYWERQFITFGACNIVSALTMDYDSTEMWMFFNDRDVPVYGGIAPISGLNYPFTLPGTLALANAEWLAQACFAQINREHTPLIYIHQPVVADMRTGAYASGGIELGMQSAALAQMARFYNVPAGAYVGHTNAKTCDAQAGFEKGMGPLTAMLGGISYLKTGGLLDALMDFDFGLAVIDAEIAQMMKRIMRGTEFSEEALSLEAIKRLGPAGMYIEHPQTLALMKETGFFPDVANRETRDEWTENGGQDAHHTALVRAREILTRENHAVLAPEVDARIRARFAGLVAGDAMAPDGWSPPVAPRTRQHASRRRRTARSVVL